MDKILDKIRSKAGKLHPFHEALAYAYQKTPLAQTAKDMIRKNYLDPRFAKMLESDPQIQAQSLFNYGKEIFSHYTCPHCQLTIHCPKEWMKHHIKTHFKPDTKKENEIQMAKIHPYR